MSPTSMDRIAQDQVQAPKAAQADDDGASTSSSAGEGMARMLEMFAEMKTDIGARLDRLGARRVEDDQASVVSAGSITSRTYAKTRAELGQNMTLASLDDEVMPSLARQHAAGQGHQRFGEVGGGQGAPPQSPREPEY
ncbi:unnamed protein product [Peronospora destructor]|uniref:Uncharacterized protein n=1 Tax=Peronospora destructor TaxID=86335 RepID=A0AAV0V388_9STRA|nr:unnamed protein product [Peronospora destructor]